MLLVRSSVVLGWAFVGAIDGATASLAGQVLVLFGIALGLAVNWKMGSRSTAAADRLAQSQSDAAMALETQREIARRLELAALADLTVKQLMLAQLQAAAEVKAELKQAAQKLAKTTQQQATQLSEQIDAIGKTGDIVENTEAVDRNTDAVIENTDATKHDVEDAA